MSAESARILVAIDGSSQADYALEWYTKYVHKEGYFLYLLHCVEPLQDITEIPCSDMYDRLLVESKEEARTLEEKYEKILSDRKIRGEISALFASRPGEIIVDMAKEKKVNMVVMGTRGLGKVRRTIMGSVSDYVVHHAQCPVIICRQPDKHVAPFE